jgi:hypothetical protein
LLGPARRRFFAVAKPSAGVALALGEDALRQPRKAACPPSLLGLMRESRWGDSRSMSAGRSSSRGKEQRSDARDALTLLADIGSHANAVGGKCLRQHEGRARDALSKETPYSPKPRHVVGPRRSGCVGRGGGAEDHGSGAVAFAIPEQQPVRPPWRDCSRVKGVAD